MKSMTFGQLPSEDEFQAAFDKHCPLGTFAFSRDKRVGDDDLTASRLWGELTLAVEQFEKGDEEAGSWASAVLSMLGFEWI